VISISKAPHGDGLHMTVLVAFDRASGRVLGTFVHASSQAEDAAGLAQSRERFLADLASHARRKPTKIEILPLPLHELPPGPLERVQPKTRKPVTKPSKHLSGITRP